LEQLEPDDFVNQRRTAAAQNNRSSKGRNRGVGRMSGQVRQFRGTKPETKPQMDTDKRRSESGNRFTEPVTLARSQLVLICVYPRSSAVELPFLN
jgi:hypothetical protein